jgi:hypothetical protein
VAGKEKNPKSLRKGVILKVEEGGEEAELVAVFGIDAVVASHNNTKQKKGTTGFKIRFRGLPERAL